MHLTRRGFTSSAVAVTAALAAGRTVMAQTPDPLAYVAPELRPIVRKAMANPQLEFSEATLPQITANAQKAMAADQGFLPGVPVRPQLLPVRSGAPDVLVYVINAKPGGSRPGIVYMHGGGFVGGTAKQQVARFQAFAQTLDCTIVSVEYALAPAARYTVSTEQTYAALSWLHREAASLGVDPRRLAVMGESAGGGLAAILAQTARDRGEVPLIFQLLVYPALDDRTGSTRPVPPGLGKIGWSAASNRFAWRSFLGKEPGSAGITAAAAAARRIDLSGLPPAWIGVGGIDLLAPECIDYARRLVETGVPTELHVVPGAYHGFDKAPGDIPLVAQFNAAKLTALRRAFGGEA